MLTLDDPRWQTMRQCGGYSTVVPALLRRLQAPAHFMDERGAFDSLRLALVRCNEVDEVSYAATPHLARLCKSGGIPPWEYIQLIAQVESCRALGRGPKVPEDTAPGYFHVIRELPQLISEVSLEGAHEEIVVANLASALAVGLGQPQLGEAILEMALTPDSTST